MIHSGSSTRLENRQPTYRALAVTGKTLVPFSLALLLLLQLLLLELLGLFGAARVCTKYHISTYSGSIRGLPSDSTY